MKLMIALVALLLGLYATDSTAQIFKITVTDWKGADAIPAVKDFMDAEILKIQNEINKDLPSAPPERLMEGMANSSVMAGKGIGSDYASYMDVFLIGGGVGAGADLEKDETSDSDISGVGVAPGLVVGFNLGFMDTARILGMDTNRLNMYFNFMNYSHEQPISDKPGEESNAKLDMMALGVHFRYDWIQPRGNKWLGWGGVKFHFGYEYNKTDITFNSTIEETISETTSSNETISGTLRGKPSAIINAATHSIPIELSTDVRLLYILSLYTGVGVDYNFGSATGKGNLNADESEINCSGGNCTAIGDPDILVRPEANIDAQGKVKPLTYRGFAGVQVNLPYVRIFGQVDKELSSNLIGATAGVRFVF